MLRKLLGREPTSDVAKRIERTAAEAYALPNSEWIYSGAARKTEEGKALLDGTPEELVELVLTCVPLTGRRGLTESTYLRSKIACDLAATALRRKLPFTEEHYRRMLDDLAKEGSLDAWQYPIAPLLGSIERSPVDGRALREPLERVASRIDPDHGADNRKLVRRILTLTGELQSDGGLPPSDDAWTQAVSEAARDEPLATRVLTLAGTATGAKPTKTFASARAALPADAGPVAARLLAAAAAARGEGQLPTDLGDVLRGLAWIADGDEAPRALADMAIAGWRKVPDFGPLSQKAATAALEALARMPEGAPQLGRVRGQLKQARAVQAVDAAIDHAAERLGIARAEFEERVVPEYDLGDVAVGDYTCRLELTGTVTIVNRDGKALKSTPAAIKEEVKGLKATAKDIAAMAAAQRNRLERLLLVDRAWDYETWRARYADHGLVGALARRLIWVFDGTPATGELETLDGTVQDPQTVRLWHPVGAPAAEVQAWRRFLEERELTQPFKQAHREVYLLTAAEEQTRTYSNRFAAHILRQHQMAALARGRGWTYALQGAWDTSDEQASLRLPEHGLTVSFWVERPWDAEDWNDSGVFNHILSDQVRYCDELGEAVALDTIPARVFSETMRDVDLFVGVTSIGNDPTWADQGERRYQEYWNGYAFGDLTEQAGIRKDLLERLLPKLAIRDSAEIDGRFLKVRGKLRTYKIHLGSGNIMMEPNDAYLCIVPARGTKSSASKVYLPFEGDQVLALILSKAFLLARDDKIDDATIVSQIRH